jgi:hypothetical protein
VKPVIESVGVKFDELAPVPAAVATEIFPVTALFGTVALIWVAARIVKDAVLLPN